MQCFSILGLICGVVLMGVTLARADIILDNFATSPSDSGLGIFVRDTSHGGPTHNAEGNGIAGVLGGARDLSLVNVTGVTRFGSVLAAVDPSLEWLVFSNGTGVRSDLHTLYDGDMAAGNQKALSLDLRHVESLQFDVVSADLGFSIAITLCSNATGTCVMDAFSKAAFPVGASFHHNLDMTNFGTDLTPTFLSNIGSIEIDYLSDLPSLDLALGGLTLVTAMPEPGTVVLLGTGLLGLGVARVRRQRAQRSS